jgi:hypothetical protein
MKTTSGARLQQRAKAWLTGELERSRKALGPSWPMHAQWVLQYLRAEMAERVAAWKAKRGQH